MTDKFEETIKSLRYMYVHTTIHHHTMHCYSCLLFGDMRLRPGFLML